VIEANALIQDLPDQIRWSAHNRVSLSDTRAAQLLALALSALDQPGESHARSFPLRDADGQPAMVAHLMPVRRSAHDIFARSAALLILTPLGGHRAPSAALLRSLFDLTVAEARVASGLALGETLEEIAAGGEVAITTVRSQLRRVLEKTGCTRQAEVVALLANVTLGRGQD